MIIDCISDLHGYYPKLEGGDLLIIAGDLTRTDTPEEHFHFCTWVEQQPYRKIIVIAGNHDNLLQQDGCLGIGDYDGIKTEYLQDSGIEFEGLKIWGSPWVKRFEGMNTRCMAFTVDSERELEEKFRQIPNGIDILVTHSPPRGYFDLVEGKDYTGSWSLLDAIDRVKPRLHVFGHVHEGHVHVRPYLELIKNHGHQMPGYPIMVNAAYVDEEYKPVNTPIRIEL